MMRLRAIARTSRTRGMSPAEAAAHWIVRQDAGALGPDDSADFEQWQSDPLHADAYRKASGAMGLFDLDLADDANLRALRQSALDAAPAPRSRYRLVGGLAIAASVAATLAFVGIEQNRAPVAAPSGPAVVASTAGSDPKTAADPSVVRTGVGERRTVKLPDGSIVTLNTNTRMAVAFSNGRRLIHLWRGQALFEVAHDANRPFTVEAADRQVTALGTIFEVRVDPGRVNVVLFRGRVVVDRTPDATGGSDEARVAPTILKPGQQFDVELGAPQKVAAVDVDRQLLWRNGFVEFDDETLGHAVAEMNRYASKPIVLNNDGVAALHVSGLFRTGSPDQFIDAIQGILPVEAKPTAQGGIELSLASRRAQ